MKPLLYIALFLAPFAHGTTLTPTSECVGAILAGASSREEIIEAYRALLGEIEDLSVLEQMHQKGEPLSPRIQGESSDLVIEEAFELLMQSAEGFGLRGAQFLRVIEETILARREILADVLVRREEASTVTFSKRLMARQGEPAVEIIFSRDEEILVAQYFGNILRVEEVATGKLLNEFSTVNPIVSVEAIFGGNQYVLVRTQRQTVVTSAGGTFSRDFFEIWDIQNSKKIQSIKKVFKTRQVGENGTVVSLLPSGKLNLYKKPGEKMPFAKASGLRKRMDKVLLSPDGSRLLTVSQKGERHLWNVLTGKKLNTFHFEQHGENTWSSSTKFSFSQDGDFFTLQRGRELISGRAADGKELLRAEMPQRKRRNTPVVVAKGAVLNNTESIEVLMPGKSKERKNFGVGVPIDLSDNGKWIAVKRKVNKHSEAVFIIEVETKRVVDKIVIEKDIVRHLRFSNDRFAFATHQGLIHWSESSEKLALWPVTGLAGNVVAISQNANFIVSSDEGNVVLINLEAMLKEAIDQ